MTIPNQSGKLALLFATLFFYQSHAGAADKELLDILLSNGAITKAQYDHLLKKKKITKEDVEFSVKNGLQFKTTDDRFQVKLGGRLHADASFHSGDPVGTEEASDGTEIRRARLDVSGVLFEDWAFQGEYDFADNEVSIKDAWIGYTGLKWLPFIAVGHQKQPYSLQVEMSSNDMIFIERSVDNVFSEALTDRAIGLRLETHGDHWFFAGGVFGSSIDPNQEDDEGWGATGRLIGAPILTETALLHLGIRGAYRVPDDNDRRVRFRDETTNMSNLRIVNADIRNVDASALAGAEIAIVKGPWSLEGEYSHAFIDRRRGRSSLDFDSWHVQIAWSLTGESRAAVYKIKSGEFKGLKPARNFISPSGGWGAWEVAARYAWVDLNDGDIRGGKEQALTLGLNWYINRNLRFMVDYTNILDVNHSPLGAGADRLDIVQMRTDLHF